MVYIAVCGFSLMPCLAVLVRWWSTSLHIHESDIQHKQDMPSTLLRALFFLLLVLSCSSHQTGHSDNTVLLPLRHLLAHAATTGTIFFFTCLSAAKSACHDYMNVFPASHCRTYYNTKLLQQSASSWLLTVYGPDAATTTTIAPATHRWCWLLSSRHRPLSK